MTYYAGYISKDRWFTFFGQFNNMDSDGDGYVCENEYEMYACRYFGTIGTSQAMAGPSTGT